MRSLLDVPPRTINIPPIIIGFNGPSGSPFESALLQPDRQRIHIIEPGVSVPSSVVPCHVYLFFVVPGDLCPYAPVIPADVIEERAPHGVQGQDFRIPDYNQQRPRSRHGN